MALAHAALCSLGITLRHAAWLPLAHGTLLAAVHALAALTITLSAGHSLSLLAEALTG